MKVSDIYKYLNFTKLDKLNLEEGKLHIQKYKTENLPEILKIELNKFDNKHISFQPHEKISKIEISLVFEFDEDIINDKNRKIDYEKSYLKQARIKIKLISMNGNNRFFFFRIDTHSEYERSKKSIFPHPLYHIQFNENDFKDIQKFDFGNITLIDTPRLFIYPMELFLVIDFILHNFAPKSRQKLLSRNQNYKIILKNLQNHFWKPFFETIYNYFNNNNQKIAKKLLPGLV